MTQHLNHHYRHLPRHHDHQNGCHIIQFYNKMLTLLHGFRQGGRAYGKDQQPGQSPPKRCFSTTEGFSSPLLLVRFSRRPPAWVLPILVCSRPTHPPSPPQFILSLSGGQIKVMSSQGYHSVDLHAVQISSSSSCWSCSRMAGYQSHLPSFSDFPLKAFPSPWNSDLITKILDSISHADADDKHKKRWW